MSAVQQIARITKYTATTTGRDKVYRFIQYFSRFLAFRLLAADPKGNKELASKITKLVKHLSLSRKLMRIGRPLEYFLNIMNGIATQKDEFIKYCLIGKNAALSVWMVFDFLAWAQGVGLWKSKNPELLSLRTNRFWITGLIFGLMSTWYQITGVLKRHLALQKVKAQNKLTAEDTLAEEKAVHAASKKLARQVFQESLDILVPARGLKWVTLSDGFIGLSGALTSLMGAESQWKKVHGGK
ncbi:hypothetical protein AMAG_02953 [Allomyces macrogynus ATCC 38327]|uniref:Peroxisomal biogenesis factor 11 n=1 Tax=Allomyces macrogynus (strain ATCC 38327) TaxID=578462 RepID=A0A0L0S3T5_ALLM3|nr:hypothetical protein AMAG_02953 [Allomyces macrogynus ATCC 38327]|eukprot:KNE57212.1 hypothetical protein AMAG_02953 [Allomyces macrogynus ATCC 38327]